MLKFTLVKGEIVLSPEIVLFKELSDVYDIDDGDKLLQSIYYMHSRASDNPFKDLDLFVKEENVFMALFKKKSLGLLKLSKDTLSKYRRAEDIFIKHTTTTESRMYASIDKKMDEIARMLDDTVPTIDHPVSDDPLSIYDITTLLFSILVQTIP